MEILDNGITFNLDSQDGYPIFYVSKDAAKNTQTNQQIKEAIEQYKSITKNTVSCIYRRLAASYSN